MLRALGRALLKVSDRENRLEYLKGLAKRQQANAKRLKRVDKISSFLCKAEYFVTRANILIVEKEIETAEVLVRKLCDDIKDSYLSPIDLEEPLDPDDKNAPAFKATANPPAAEKVAPEAAAEEAASVKEAAEEAAPVEGEAKETPAAVEEKSKSAAPEVAPAPMGDIDDAS